MIIREALPNDAESISRVVCTCYDQFGETEGYPETVIADLKESRGCINCISEAMQDEALFVAEEDGRLVGMVSVKEKELTKLYVTPESQKSGIGKALFVHAEAFIKSQGHSRMFLRAALQKPVPFYERMGMRISMKRKVTFGPCSGMTAIELEKKLSE